MQTEKMGNWRSEEEKEQMEEEVTGENCGDKLRLVRDVHGMSRRELAKALGVRESTIYRLERHITKPSGELMNRLRALVVIGYAKFSRLKESEKNRIAEFVGAGAGVGAGVGAAVGAVAAAGTIGGLSAAGITSGLAAIGGTMLGGIAVVAAIPAATAGLGYGIIRGIKTICEANELSCQEVDGRYEITRDGEQKDRTDD